MNGQELLLPTSVSFPGGELLRPATFSAKPLNRPGVLNCRTYVLDAQVKAAHSLGLVTGDEGI